MVTKTTMHNKKNQSVVDKIKTDCSYKKQQKLIFFVLEDVCGDGLEKKIIYSFQKLKKKKTIPKVDWQD